MKLLIFIAISLIQATAMAGECGENCFEKNMDTSPEKETVKLDITKPGTIEVKIVNKTSIPITTTADLDDMYQLSVTDRDNDGDFDFSINWIEDKTKMNRTKIFQNKDGKFIDVTNSEK